MKLSDIAERVVVDSRKLTHYALDVKSPLGKHKALVFENTLGFTIENYADLLHQLETKSLNAEAMFHSEDKHGKRYTVDISVDGTEGRQAIVRTGWFVPTGTNEAHLVTLYIKRR